MKTHQMTLFDRTVVPLTSEQANRAIENKALGIDLRINGEYFDHKSIATIRKIKGVQTKFPQLPERVENPVKPETIKKVRAGLKNKFGWPK